MWQCIMCKHFGVEYYPNPRAKNYYYCKADWHKYSEANREKYWDTNGRDCPLGGYNPNYGKIFDELLRELDNFIDNKTTPKRRAE